ncbi:MAG: acyl-CoA dehydrogenase [Desulfomonilaceae bacterium]
MGQNFYKRNNRDTLFVLKEYLDVQKLLRFPRYEGFAMEDFEMIIEQADKIAGTVLAPTFQDSDRAGCVFDGQNVHAPACFHQCWRVFKEGGWFALTQSPQYGGQGLPFVIAEAATECFMSANFAFACYSGMGPGNGALIERFGSEELKKMFLPKLYDGTWCACMCLTEPDVGSDAHMVSTRAVPEGGLYKIRGKKLFITSGEHDLTENIIHFVIARRQGDPPGAKGVSLFAVPKIWVNPDGSLGQPNDVVCLGIEHKMGLNGSATCAMNYGDHDNCRGYLIGEPGGGLAYMFDMVITARLAVGLEAVAFGANIYANALEYAKQRLQGTRFGVKGGPRVRIIEHPDVRRMLMNLKALTEGMRALVYKAYFYQDVANASPDDEARIEAQKKLKVLTPMIKAYCSDRVFEMGREGIQILGGYGFTKEYPIEQYTRDSKILSIWDGTNYIQSVDLVGRNFLFGSGDGFRDWMNEIKDFCLLGQQREDFSGAISLLHEALEMVRQMSLRYVRYLEEQRWDLIPLTSVRFLDCCAELTISHLLIEQAFLAQDRLRDCGTHHRDALFYRGKIETAHYYVRNFLPQVFGRVRMMMLEDLSAVTIAEDSF